MKRSYRIWNSLPIWFKAWIKSVKANLGLQAMMVYPTGSQYIVLIAPKDDLSLYDGAKIIDKQELCTMHGRGLISNVDIAKLFIKYL